ncbi:unnamed protein product [Anisakis simplex]|uniref:Putative nudix hydrolase 2 (inferred by orthology to a C. elegans protein) n=1 Tax=Anisakis simplex TaxID=6269 RepID=A0A0M3JYS2_ANISI|nr:unnamed protein product [Anisakis simplex]
MKLAEAMKSNAAKFDRFTGLLDDNETIVDAAKRELKEETGYTASKVECLSIARHPLAAQMTDNSICYAFAEIDGDSAQNQNPKPVLEESEVIEVRRPHNDIPHSNKEQFNQSVSKKPIERSDISPYDPSNHIRP